MNGRLWGGLVLSVAAFVSYFVFFFRYPITRDIPWINILLFLIALVLLVTGFRRARRKIGAAIVVVIGVAVAVVFGFAVTVASKVPDSPSAPRVGQKAPELTLLDSTGHSVSLAQLVASSPRGVLLVFYRGYW
jgi:ABC-type Fe3+-siderophore transport system permease subunit